MYLFDELINQNSLKPHINYTMMEKEKVMQCKHKVTFYFTKYNDSLMFYNTAGTYEGNQMYWNSETVLYNLNEHSRKTILRGKDTISHNFTPIMNDPNKKRRYYAVGGCGKKGEKAREPDHHYKKGIYLLESNDMYNWKIVDLIIHGDKYKGWNPVNRESIFDSNIECFYSKILKKYLLFTRYNYAVGSRTMQVITSPDYNNWDGGQMVNIDSYKRYDNYYMYKIMEIPSLNLFMMVSPFSVLRPPLDLIHKGKVNLEEMDFIYGFKLLLSRDAVNWKDCGMMAHIPAAMKHDATPVMQPTSFRMVDKYTVELEFHDLYFTKQQSTIYRSMIDLRNFIGVQFSDTTIFNKKVRIRSPRMKINFGQLPKREWCYEPDYSGHIQSGDIQSGDIQAPEQNESTQTDIQDLNDKHTQDIYNNQSTSLSYEIMSNTYPSMISSYAHSFQKDKLVAPVHDEMLTQFKTYKDKMELKFKDFEEKLASFKPKIEKQEQEPIIVTSSYLHIYINGEKYEMNNDGIIQLPIDLPLNREYEITFRARNIILYSIE